MFRIFHSCSLRIILWGNISIKPFIWRLILNTPPPCHPSSQNVWPHPHGAWRHLWTPLAVQTPMDRPWTTQIMSISGDSDRNLCAVQLRVRSTTHPCWVMVLCIRLPRYARWWWGCPRGVSPCVCVSWRRVWCRRWGRRRSRPRLFRSRSRARDSSSVDMRPADDSFRGWSSLGRARRRREYLRLINQNICSSATPDTRINIIY